MEDEAYIKDDWDKLMMLSTATRHLAEASGFLTDAVHEHRTYLAQNARALGKLTEEMAKKLSTLDD